MKTVKLHMIIALGALFGVVATQKASSPAPSACDFFAIDKFNVPQNQDIVPQNKPIIDYFQAVCSATNNGNDKFQRLIWRALVEKQDKALEVLIDMIQHAQNMDVDRKNNPKLVKEMTVCLNEIGQERCLAGVIAKTVGGVALGLVGKEFAAEGYTGKKLYSDYIRTKESNLQRLQTKEDTALTLEKDLKELYELRTQQENNNLLNLKDKNFSIYKEIAKKESLYKEIAKKESDYMRIEALMPSDPDYKEKLEKSLSETKTNEQNATIKMFAGGVVAIAAGALALEGGIRYYQSRQEQNRWEAFKKTDNYQKMLATHFNNFVNESLPKLYATNKAIETFLAKNNQNSLLKASLRWVIENLNKGSWLVSKEEIQTIFNCIITPKEDNACDLPTSWGTGRFKQEFNYDIYMQPKYQAQIIMRFILDGKLKSPKFVQKAEVETCPE